MPSNWLYIDTNFPTFTGEESANEKVEVIQNYLFMLVEQLRYTLRNLDTKNMNQTALSNFENLLTDPIYAEITDQDGRIAQLSITADAIQTRLTDAEGNISTLQQTATSLTARVSNSEGDISILQQTATSLTTRVTNSEGDISVLQQTATSLTTQLASTNKKVSGIEQNVSMLQQTATSLTTRVSSTETNIDDLTGKVTSVEYNVSTLEQTATSITTRVESTEADIDDLTGEVTNVRSSVSELQQTATSLTARVSNSEGEISTLKQTATSLITRIANAEGDVSSLEQTVNGLTLSVENGSGWSKLSLKSGSTTLSTSGQITLGGNVVFVNDLKDGETVISGDNITTGTISASRIAVDDLKIKRLWGHNSKTPAIDASSSTDWLYIGGAYSSYLYDRIMLQSRYGVDIKSGSAATYLRISPYLGGIEPQGDWNLGTYTYPFANAYIKNLFVSGTIYGATTNGGTIKIGGSSSYLSFFGATGARKQSVSTSATLATLISALSSYGLV